MTTATPCAGSPLSALIYVLLANMSGGTFLPNEKSSFVVLPWFLPRKIFVKIISVSLITCVSHILKAKHILRPSEIITLFGFHRSVAFMASVEKKIFHILHI